MKTQLLQETVPLCAFLCFFFRQPLFCDDLGACTNSLFPFYYQFKLTVSPFGFGKPCFCLHARTWFVKIKWRHGELELIVKREQRICTSPQIIAKKWLSFCAVPPPFFPVGWVSTGTLSARCFFLVGSSARLVLLAPR